MGLLSWFQHHAPQEEPKSTPSASELGGTAEEIWPGPDWEEVPAYLPANPADHIHACVIASAIAAGDYPESAFSVKSISIANPEHQRVACIASALAAGALASSSFVVTHIYKRAVQEEAHAA